MRMDGKMTLMQEMTAKTGMSENVFSLYLTRLSSQLEAKMWTGGFSNDHLKQVLM
jgi:hypothetical protein